MSKNEIKTMISQVCWTFVTVYLCLMPFCMSGCGGGEDSPIIPDNPATENNKMAVSPDTLYLKADGSEKGSFQVKLQKTGSFFAKAEKDWCKLDNADGNGSSAYTVSVKADPNTQEESRTSRISFYSGEHTEYAYVVQKAVEKAKEITITPDTLYLDAEIGSKGTVTVHLIDNTTYDIGGTSHFEREVVEEEDGKVLKITYTVKYESKEDLIFKMGVQQHDKQKFYYVCQKAKKQAEGDQYNITISPNVHDVEARGGEVFSLIELDNQSAVTVTSDAVWCIPRDANFERPATQFKLYMNVKENLTEQSRTAIITVKAGSSAKTCTVTQQGSQIDVSYIGGTVGSEVDLGLSVYWSSHNVGASKNTQSGVYFAWGEIKGKNVYKDDTYIYYDNDKAVYVDIGEGISGRPQYDAATAYWKEGWRIPTWAEFHELINECTWEWVQIDKVNGYKVTGPNKNSIFIPAMDNQFGNYKEITEYTDVKLWSDCLSLTDKAYAYGLSCTSTRIGRGNYSRYIGIPIRPVKYKNSRQAGGGIVNGE